MKLPGPDHPIAIAPLGRHVTVRFAGAAIGESDGALSLKEANYPEVVYVPRGDLAMDRFSRTDKSTHCPYKGDATYFTVAANGQRAENVAWSYEAPFPAMAEIRDCLAFYPGQIEIVS
jgi:uncharacterized protein (DUF427 family)